MDLFSKKTLLSSINGAGIYGAPTDQATVKFMYTTNLATAASNSTVGGLVFANDGEGHAAIWSNGTILSSAIQSVVPAATTGNKHGGKTVTITYIVAATGAVETNTFNVIDEAGLEAYFANSKTIALDANNIYEVKTDGKTILVDNALGLKTGLSIDYVAAATGVPAHIALLDASSNELSTVEVSDIIGNGILDHSDYDASSNTLKLYFKQADGTLKEEDVDLSELFDIDDWAVKNDSKDFLSLTIDASTAEIGVKKADVTFTAAVPGTSEANLTVDTTAGKILDAADAIPAIKDYILAVQSDNGIAVESKNSYIDASIDSANNKKVNIEAQTANLTIASGTAGGASDSSLSGTAGKLVDAADAASKVQSFVNARLDEEIQKLDASIDSTGHTFIEVGVAEANGKVTEVVVHEKIGSITGTASSLTGETGLIDGGAAATAITTYVEGKINALDTSVSASTTDGSISFKVEEENGLLSGAQISYVKAQTTFTAATDKDHPATLTSTDGLLSGAAIADIVSYVNAKTGALDSSVTDTDAAGFVTVYIEQQDGALKSDEVTVNYGSYNYTAGTHTFGTATDGIAKVADTQTFVQNVIESLDLASNVSDASAIDASNFVKTTISETDGIVKNESVEVTYATVTAAPGDITVSQNGIVKGDVLESAIEGALKWTVLN